MNIAPNKDPDNRSPKTRKELLYHLWGSGLTDVNIWKEGPFYACRIGRTIYATYLRRIDSLYFSEWERRVRCQAF